MSLPNASPQSLIFSPFLSFNNVSDDDDDCRPPPPRKFSVPTTSSTPRHLYARRRSRMGALTPTRSSRLSQRRISLPAIHFHHTSVSTLHVDAALSRERSGSIPNNVYDALQNFSFGAPPSPRPTPNDADNTSRASTPLGGRIVVERKRSSVVTVSAIRRSVASLQPQAAEMRSDERRRDSNTDASGLLYIPSGPSAQPSPVTDTWDPSFILSSDEPVAVNRQVARSDMSLGPVLEGGVEPVDAFMDHIRRVEDPKWTFTCEERSDTPPVNRDRPGSQAIEGGREGWWCEPLGRFLVCKIGYIDKSTRTSQINYNRLKIRRETESASGPAVLVHRHSKVEAFSIYRCFTPAFKSKTLDASLNIVLGTRSALKDYAVARARRTMSKTEIYKQADALLGLSGPQRPTILNNATESLISSRPMEVDASREHIYPPQPSLSNTTSAAGPPRIDTDLGAGRKSFFRSLLESLSIRLPLSPIRENRRVDKEETRKEELNQIIDCFTSVGLLPPSQRKRGEETSRALANIPHAAMCMLLPLWAEPNELSKVKAARRARRTSHGSQYSTRKPSSRSSTPIPQKDRKYLLVYYVPDLQNSQPRKTRRMAKNKAASAFHYGGFFSAHGRILTHDEVRDSPLPLPERGLCVPNSVAMPRNRFAMTSSDDLTLALTTREAGIMIYNDSFEELGLVEDGGETASEMGKAIAEMVWCGCITLMTFKS